MRPLCHGNTDKTVVQSLKIIDGAILVFESSFETPAIIRAGPMLKPI